MAAADHEQESIFYHALNSSGNWNHKTLAREHARCGSWKRCWERRGLKGLDPEKAWKALAAAGIGLELISGNSYPPFLKEIHAPPHGLYFKGSLEILSNPVTIAIVGTRKASLAGKDAAKRFASSLAQAGCLIVSGLAFGIDAAAHAGALETGGLTAAVLANGLERVYPASHRFLAEHIIEGGGVLVSEYPPGSPALAHRFLERNRIVSGLARAVLAIEVPERSGVLATARFALDQDRDLFVVPGPANHPNFQGSHKLIRRGATLVSGPADIFEDLGLRYEIVAAAQSPRTPEEKSVLEVLSTAGTPLTIDEISTAATLTSSTANQALTMLVLKEVIREEDGRYTLR